MPGARVTDGERITLRTVEQEDIQFIQRSLANSEIRYPMGNPVMNQAQVEDHHEDNDSDRFLVCLENDAGPGQPDVDSVTSIACREDDNAVDSVTRIGLISVSDADWKRPELAYWIIPEVHGHGYGKEAVSLVIEYVFRTYDTPAVGAEAYDYNDASRGLLESLGFTKEGRRRKFMFIEGEHRDMIQYGLLRREWYNQK